MDASEGQAGADQSPVKQDKDVYVAQAVDTSAESPFATSRPVAKALSADDNMLTATFSPDDLQRVVDMVEQFFVGQGYRLEYGVPASGCYGIGSDVMRLLLGAFARRFKFEVAIGPHATGEVWLQVTKGMSGAMGGVLGYNAMKKETTRVFDALRS